MLHNNLFHASCCVIAKRVPVGHEEELPMTHDDFPNFSCRKTWKSQTQNG